MPFPLILVLAVLGSNASPHENWMSELPANVTAMPLVGLKIPGSHDAFSYSVSIFGKIDPTEPDILKKLGKIPFAKIIIKRWSVTQGLSAIGQLKSGIRYFDIRTVYDKTRDKFYAVHGLYGENTLKILAEMVPFFDGHPREVVILDFSHNFNNASIDAKYMTEIQRVLGNHICPPGNIAQISLQDSWDQSCQVIALYHGGNPKPPFYDGDKSIDSPWPNTDSLMTLFPDLVRYLAERNPNRFFVTQALRTETTKDIVRNLLSSLKKKISEPTTYAAVSWIRGLDQDLKRKVNIIEADFTEMYGFVDIVVGLNYKL